MRVWDAARAKPIGAPFTGHDGRRAERRVQPRRKGGRVRGRRRDCAAVGRRARDAAGEPARRPHGRSAQRRVRPGGRRLASAGADGTVRLWDVARSAPVGPPLEVDADGVWSVAFSPDGRMLATGGADWTVRLWDVGRGTQLGDALEGHTGEVRSIAFSRDGTRLASASEDGTVRLWDVGRQAPVGKPLEGHAGWVLSVAFSPDGAHARLGRRRLDRTPVGRRAPRRAGAAAVRPRRVLGRERRLRPARRQARLGRRRHHRPALGHRPHDRRLPGVAAAPVRDRGPQPHAGRVARVPSRRAVPEDLPAARLSRRPRLDQVVRTDGRSREDGGGRIRTSVG